MQSGELRVDNIHCNAGRLHDGDADGAVRDHLLREEYEFCIISGWVLRVSVFALKFR